MYLKQLIERLEKEDPDRVLPLGFSHAHAYRGNPNEVAFVPTRNLRVAQLLSVARGAVGATYGGWKGGEFAMDEWTRVWLAETGCEGETIGHVLLDYMLAAAPNVGFDYLISAAPNQALSDRNAALHREVADLRDELVKEREIANAAREFHRALKAFDRTLTPMVST